MNDIRLEGTILLCYQKVWPTEVLEVAKFLWMTIDPQTNVISINLPMTYKKGVIAFLRHAYPTFMRSPQHKADRAALQQDLQQAYNSIYLDFEQHQAPLIPYWDHVYDEVHDTYTPLFQHQKEAIVAMYHRKNNFLAYEMRTGKTITSMSNALASRSRRTVIVCYDVGKFSFMKDLCSKRWNKHIQSFDPFEFTVLCSARRRTIHAFNEKYVIVNYEAVTKYLDALIHSGTKATDHIIFDEAQKVKSTSTATHRICRQLIEECPDARLTMMTGTPVMNRIDDLFAYFKMSKHPLGESRAHFEKLFIIRNNNQRSSKVTGVRQADLLSDILGNFMLRKRLDECVDVPKKAHVKLYYPLGEYEQAYDDAVRAALITEGKVNESNFSSLTSLMAQAKCPGTIEQIKLLVDQGEKVVVFTSYSKPLDILSEAMRSEKIGYVRVDGKIDGAEKVARAEKFNTDPECKVFLGQMRAAGHSISLYAANHTIILNQPLTASDIKQCLFRDVTMTKQQASTVYYAICTRDDGEATIDEVVLDLNISKYEDANDVIDRGEAMTSIENAAEVVYRAMMEQYEKQHADL
jgi:SNF2 family DNA or RNA helicase